MAKLNIKRQIEKVQDVQQLSFTDAYHQVMDRLYDAREYLKRRAQR